MSDASTELERLQAAITASGDVVYDWDLPSDEFTWLGRVTDAFQISGLHQISSGELFHQRIHPEDLTKRLDQISCLYQGSTEFECEFRVRDVNGDQRWFHDRGVAEMGPGGKPIRLRGTMRAINQRKDEHERTQYLANYDELTGHFNKNRLREALDQALYYGTRYKVVGAYLVIEIDNINIVNQAFGYEIADAVIVALGHRLDRCLRSCDIIGRLGGDRFGVVLSNCPGSELPIAAEKLLEVARNTEVDTPAGPIHVTVSIGAAGFPDAAMTASDAMTKADIALQNAKSSGRNTWSAYCYTEAQRESHRKNMVIAEQVKQALHDDRLVLSYQPIVSSDTHEPVVHECLLRMIQPDGEVVAAGMFMEVVEELGLIRLIDRRVLDLAIKVMAENPTARLAINVSGLTTSDKTWLRHIVGLLRNERSIAERLIVEITETAGLEDVDECARFVATLRKLGCKVALDDFGAGYTSFRHLKILAVDMVKIDGAFVRDLVQNPANMIFIRSLLDLARNFNLETVAECVETMEQAQLLKDEGVKLLQGWAFGKPVLELPWNGEEAELPVPKPLAIVRQPVRRIAG